MFFSEWQDYKPLEKSGSREEEKRVEKPHNFFLRREKKTKVFSVIDFATKLMSFSTNNKMNVFFGKMKKKCNFKRRVFILSDVGNVLKSSL